MVEKYTLNWQTFSENLKLMFKDLYKEGRYADVTLVSDDQIQFKAHKMVLSACSPVLKTIIDSNPSQNPLIYLRGIQSYEIQSILELMYLGEGTVFQDRMGELVSVAKDLQVKEINDAEELPSKEEDIIDDDIIEDIKDEPLPDECKKQQDNRTNQMPVDRSSTKCPVCDKEFKYKHHMLKHHKSVHENIRFPCPQCDLQATTQSSLRRHFQAKHEGIKHPCDYCDYQATQKWDIKRHIQAVHEGVKYPCNQCDYHATTQGSLQKHIHSIHEDIKYPCDICEYQASEKESLKNHVVAKHTDRILHCDDCDYKTKWRASYRTHRKTHHAKN